MNKLKLLLLAVLLLASPLACPVFAQDTPPAATTDANAAPADAPKKNQDTTFIQILEQGGLVMLPLGVAWILVFYFFGDGLYTFRVAKLAPAAVIARIREVMASGNYQEAWNICKANKSFLTTVLAAGLERIGRGKDSTDFAIEESAVRESTILRANSTYLSVIGVVSPMIGLTGTVMGMINAFRTLGSSGIADPSKLAESIGEVLVATATGLIVAIPAFIFYYILRTRSQTSILIAESRIYRLIDDIPYDQISGIRIGDDFSPAPGASNRNINVSQKVAPAAGPTTSCPACNAAISVGTTPCPNCGTVLDWGS